VIHSALGRQQVQSTFMGNSQGSQPSFLEKLSSEVKVNSARIENDIVKPLTRQSRELMSQRPILFTFLLVTAVLSVIPLSCFVLFTIITLGGCVCLITLLAVMALCTTLFLFMIVTGPLFVLMTITILACALWITCFVVGGYLAQRLRVHVQKAGSFQQGFPLWLGETREKLFGQGHPRYEPPKLKPAPAPTLEQVQKEEESKPVLRKSEVNGTHDEDADAN